MLYQNENLTKPRHRNTRDSFFYTHTCQRNAMVTAMPVGVKETCISPLCLNILCQENKLSGSTYLIFLYSRHVFSISYFPDLMEDFISLRQKRTPPPRQFNTKFYI